MRCGGVVVMLVSRAQDWMIFVPVGLWVWRTEEVAGLWWEVYCGRDMIVPLAVGNGVAWAVEWAVGGLQPGVRGCWWSC